MQKIDKHIEIVSSTMNAFSCLGPATRRTLQAILARRYRSVGITIVNTLPDLEALVARQPDLVFLGMKYIASYPALGATDPHKIWLSEYLDAAGIAYTGSGAAAVKLEASKQLAKQRVLDAGLASAGYSTVRHDVPLALQPVILPFPLFVKPSDRGGGLGIAADSLVLNEQELAAKVSSITHDLRADALVEEYLPGREFSVAVLQQPDSAELTIMPIELVTAADARGARILGQKVKSSNVEQALAVVESPLRQAVCTLAQEAFMALGARDYGRIDIRLDGQGIPHFIEANLYPSLTSGYGSFPKAYALSSSQPYESLILAIAELGLRRAEDTAIELPTFYGELAVA